MNYNNGFETKVDIILEKRILNPKLRKINTIQTIKRHNSSIHISHNNTPNRFCIEIGHFSIALCVHYYVCKHAQCAQLSPLYLSLSTFCTRIAMKNALNIYMHFFRIRYCSINCIVKIFPRSEKRPERNLATVLGICGHLSTSTFISETLCSTWESELVKLYDRYLTLKYHTYDSLLLPEYTYRIETKLLHIIYHEVWMAIWNDTNPTNDICIHL